MTWFDRDGNITHKTAVNDIGDCTAMVTLMTPNGPMVRGINEDWQIAPHSSTTGAYNGFIGSTPDSRVFFDEFSSQPGLIALDIYIHGHRVNTLGPFIPCFPSTDVAINDDGSSALLVWKDDSKTNTQIVAVNANGILQFQADCGGFVWNPIVAPDAAGVLVRPNEGGTNQNHYMWFTKQGKMHSMEIIPNPECLGWIPESRESLFCTRLGDNASRFQVVDWDTGKTALGDLIPGRRASAGHWFDVGTDHPGYRTAVLSHLAAESRQFTFGQWKRMDKDVLCRQRP